MTDEDVQRLVDSYKDKGSRAAGFGLGNTKQLENRSVEPYLGALCEALFR